MSRLIILLFLSCSTFQSWANHPTYINDDTTRFKLGKRILLITNGEEDDFDWDEEEDEKKNNLKLLPSFNFGINGYLNKNHQFNLTSPFELYNLNYAKSSSYTLNLMLKGVDLFNKRLYFSPGIGLNWNSYSFQNNIAISNINDSTNFSLETVIDFDKYKLKNLYVQAPLIIGLRMGNVNKNPFGLQIGAVASYKLSTKIKQKYSTQETLYKDKIKNSYNINPVKVDAIARLSIGFIGLYARCSLTSLFEVNKAAELYPFSAGITIGGF